jgi:translation initiation factor 1
VKTNRTGALVYSTGLGRLCPQCHQQLSRCQCSRKPAAAPGDGIVRVSRETKGRKGKGVTLVSGLPLATAELKSYATKLKKLCGSGGAVKDGVIEIQGDHRDRLLAELQGQGWSVKRSGG